MKKTQYALLILCCLLLSTRTCLAMGREKSALDDRIRSVLTWLPVDTDSIAVMQSPVTYDLNSDQPIEPESIYQFPFLQFLLISSNKASESDVTLVPLSDIQLSIQTCGRWHSDSNSIARSIGYFTFLSPDRTRDDRMRDTYQKNATKIHLNCDIEVYEFNMEPCYEDETKNSKRLQFYKCLPTPGLVIVALDKAFMYQVLRKMTDVHSSWQALPQSLPMWKEVDVSSRYWGLRRFQAGDPTSPRSKRETTPSSYPYPAEDTHALGLTFSYDPKSMDLDVCYFSTNERRREIVKRLCVPRGFGDWGKTSINHGRNLSGSDDCAGQ